MSFQHLCPEVMILKTDREKFDVRTIRNRRFMFCPRTHELILGREDTVTETGLCGSHAEEHMRSGTQTPYDDFVKGWVAGPLGDDPGIIHFAPAIPADNCRDFERVWAVLDMFLVNGAAGKTIVRGFGSEWERPLNNVLSD